MLKCVTKLLKQNVACVDQRTIAQEQGDGVIYFLMMRQIKHAEEKSKVARLFVVLAVGLFAFLLLSLISRVAYA